MTIPNAKPRAPLTVLPYLRTLAGGQVRLLATQCKSCGYHTFPPSTVCPRCMSLEVEPLELSSVGELYSYTTMRHADGQVYSGYVDFPEKIRVFGHLWSTAGTRPHCTMQVRVVAAAPVEGARTSAPVDFKFEPADDARRLA